MPNLIGIDMGSTRLKVATLDAGGNPVMMPNASGDNCTPSVVYFDDGRTLVGSEALNMSILDPKRCIMNAKRQLGTDQVLYKQNGQVYRAVDIIKILILYVITMVEARSGERPQDVVISIPANFKEDKRRQIEEAAVGAGLNVILMPHEPTAALFGCQAHKRGDGLRVVIDIGGSTLDVTIAEVCGNTTQIVTTNGLPELGGIEFHKRLEERALAQCDEQFKSRPDPKHDELCSHSQKNLS